ncbi:MAG: rRNA maturation RNase YbeY [Cytophagaceae bacterium]|nr:rRNA maturation RNase YbeY [Cytophagaceae bacterium]MBK9936136.1 rRNA maturation RNase YbeY [Cytophagaceae bacterium]MBL0303976.1 rRNA maturation RNase YbeY [Cytophagaceae bacterium]
MINFHSEKEGFKLKEILKKKRWLKELAQNEGFKILELSYIFMDDESLLKINIEYLQHDTYTDIITFDNSEKKGKIEGDIFISVDRVMENASKFKVDFETELLRVLAHGLLHLCGYKDKKDDEVKIMRAKEDFYLQNWI